MLLFLRFFRSLPEAMNVAKELPYSLCTDSLTHCNHHVVERKGQIRAMLQDLVLPTQRLEPFVQLDLQYYSLEYCTTVESLHVFARAVLSIDEGVCVSTVGDCHESMRRLSHLYTLLL